MPKSTQNELLHVIEELVGKMPITIKLQSLPKIDTQNYQIFPENKSLSKKQLEKIAAKIEKQATTKRELNLVSALRSATADELKPLTETGYLFQVNEDRQFDKVKEKLKLYDYTALIKDRKAFRCGDNFYSELEEENSYTCVALRRQKPGDLIRLLGIENCCNFGLSCEFIARQVDKWDRKLEIEVLEVTYDTLGFKIKNMPPNPELFIKQMIKICPEFGEFDADIIEDKAAFNKCLSEAVKNLKKNKEVFCWWD